MSPWHFPEDFAIIELEQWPHLEGALALWAHTTVDWEKIVRQAWSRII
jgi:hypothetical protein